MPLRRASFAVVGQDLESGIDERLCVDRIPTSKPQALRQENFKRSSGDHLLPLFFEYLHRGVELGRGLPVHLRRRKWQRILRDSGCAWIRTLVAPRDEHLLRSRVSQFILRVRPSPQAPRHSPHSKHSLTANLITPDGRA